MLCVLEAGKGEFGLTVAKDQELFALADGYLSEEREEVVGHSLWILAHDAGGVRTARVEVA